MNPPTPDEPLPSITRQQTRRKACSPRRFPAEALWRKEQEALGELARRHPESKPRLPRETEADPADLS